VFIEESLTDADESCTLTIVVVHNVHNPKSESHGCRCLHPAIEEGIHFAHSTGLSTHQVISVLQSLALAGSSDVLAGQRAAIHFVDNVVSGIADDETLSNVQSVPDQPAATYAVEQAVGCCNQFMC